MAPSDAVWRLLIRACAQHRVKLMIGYRLHFESANLIAVEVARGGEIGAPRIFSSVFALQVREGNTRVQPRRGAGPLYDLGVYCVNAARYLFRAEPVEASALKLAGHDPRFANVDEAYAAALRFPGERVAQFTCSFGAYDRSHYEVVGTDGVITLDNAYEYATEMTMRDEGPHGVTERTFPRRDQNAAELAYFARCVREDRDPEPCGWEGLADVRILQAIQASARFGRAVPIEPVEPHRGPHGGPHGGPHARPDLGQEIRLPAHDPLALVDVERSSR
jgi:glucose-fructose oxidoreductase